MPAAGSMQRTPSTGSEHACRGKEGMSEMSGYAVRKLEEVPDAFGGQYPGSMRFLTEALGNHQIAFTHRLMPPKTGGKGSYGHRHKTQEEIYYVISGHLQF